MIINRNKLLILFSILQISILFLFLTNFNLLYIEPILQIIFYLFIPGFLLISIFISRSISASEKFTYSVSLSISFLIILGLLFNILLPIMGIIHPLSAFNSFLYINIFIIFLIPFAYKKLKSFHYKILFNAIKIYDLVLIFSSIFLLTLSILGAFILNNGGLNYIAVAFIILTAFYIILISLSRKKISEKIYPVVILILSLGLLLSYSLRSSYVLGWDINQEYLMFQLTKNNFKWGIELSNSIYNTCLSVTILPTLISNLIKIQDVNIFKFIYQLLFITAPLNVYLISRKFVSPLLAFLAAFFFAAQQSFYMQLTSVVRQEIALIFFTSLICILFNNKINKIQNNSLIIIFGLSLIMSHYSSAYITLFLMLSTYFMSMLFKLLYSKILKNHKISLVSNLQFFPIIILLIATLFWNTLSSGSFVNLNNTYSSVINNLKNTFNLTNRSSTIYTFLFNSKKTYSEADLDKYRNSLSNNFLLDSNNNVNLDARNYDLDLATELYPTSLKSLSAFSYVLPYTMSKYLIIIGLFIGILYLIIKKTYIYINILDYLSLNISGLLLISLIIIIPHISRAYNIDRLFQQILTFSASLITIGLVVTLRKLKNLSYIIITFIIVIYYIYQSGITANLTNDVLRVNTNNNGLEYDAHYVHAEDQAGMLFISKNISKNSVVHTDILTEIKFYSLNTTQVKTYPYIFPELIIKNNYIYSGYTNSKRNIASIHDEIHSNYSFLFIDFPSNYLNDNKSLIYNNGGAKIYK